MRTCGTMASGRGHFFGICGEVFIGLRAARGQRAAHGGSSSSSLRRGDAHRPADAGRRARRHLLLLRRHRCAAPRNALSTGLELVVFSKRLHRGVSVASSTARANVWVGVSGFTGGVLGLNANEPAAIPLGDVVANTTVPAYFFMTASPMTDSAIAQNFTVTLYQGDPAHEHHALLPRMPTATARASTTRLQGGGEQGEGRDRLGAIAASVSTSSPVIRRHDHSHGRRHHRHARERPGRDTVHLRDADDAAELALPVRFRLVGTSLTLSPGTAGAGDLHEPARDLECQLVGG